MNISDPRTPIGPNGSVGSVINVVASAVFGVIAIVVGLVEGTPGFFVVGLVFWGMCLFAFVPVMKRARKYEQERREAQAAMLAKAREG